MMLSLRIFSRKMPMRRCFSGIHNCDTLISVNDASTKIGQPKVKFIDVRDPRHYAQGHIPGAVNITEFFTYLTMTSPRGIKHLQKTFTNLLQDHGINGDEQLITYEGMMRGMYGASCRAWYLLDLLGHPNVRVLHGGWEAWKAEEKPEASGENQVSNKGTFEVNWNTSKWADLKDVKTLIEKGGAKLLDVRDIVEWSGYSSSPYGVDYAPRKGRLPTAVHLEWYDFMTADENDIVYFKSPEEIRAIVEEKGITPNDHVVVYCFKGARAANSMIALKLAGFNNVKNYFGSWNEWSRFEDLTIDEETYEMDDAGNSAREKNPAQGNKI